MAQSDDPNTRSLYDKRASIAQSAKFERLEPYKYHDMIDKFAQRFGQHPDKIYAHTSFSTISLFLCKWKEEMEADDRYHEIEKMIQAEANPPKQ